MTRTYYSNGKLLLSGEYLVLRGARSLVVPLKVGQQMKVVATGYDDDPIIRWHAHILGEPWFYADVYIKGWRVIETNHDEIADRLIKVLKEAGELNEMLYKPKSGFEIITDTSFNHNWGFGSSSALIANIAQWAVIDPFELHFRISDGSGADVAAAISNGPILYRLIDHKPNYSRVDFHPRFLKNLWLIYTGNKQNTAHIVSLFKAMPDIAPETIGLIDRITFDMIQADSIYDFMILLSEHEKLISDIIEIPPVKNQFPDFPGEIKSLGAWGGDFILAASAHDEPIVREYFRRKKMHTVFTFDQIVLQ